MATATLRLHPAEAVIFRENRYFGRGNGADVCSFPLPKTIAGAVRAYLLRAYPVDFAAVRAELRNSATGSRDPLEVLRQQLDESPAGATWPVDTAITGPFLWLDGTRFLPAPKCLVMQEDGSLTSLRPVEDASVPGWRSDDELVALTTGSRAPFEPLDETYLSWSAVRDYLNDGVLPSAQEIRDGARDGFISDEMRVGVGISKETGTAQEGLLYTSTFMRLRHGCAFEVELEFPGEELPERFRERIAERQWLRLGGEGKVARIELVEGEEHKWAAPDGDRSLLYLATPGRFGEGRWKPAGLNGSLVAAAVGSPVPFARWDLATNTPMRSQYAVAAGAVYYCNSLSDSPHQQCIADDANDKASGWGYCLQGAW